MVRPRGRSECEQEFRFGAQREDIHWDDVELTEPYSLEAVTTRDELIGREEELKRLLRLSSLQTVGSAFIYGHKRVGKTSLANAVEERLKSDTAKKWLVINKGSGTMSVTTRLVPCGVWAMFWLKQCQTTSRTRRRTVAGFLKWLGTPISVC